MKRKLFLKSLVASVFGVLCCALLVFANSETQPTETINPYDAIKKVYDEFDSIEGVAEIKFENLSANNSKPEKVRCKLVARGDADSQWRDSWLVFREIDTDSSKVFTKKRYLARVFIASKPLHDLAKEGEEYNPEKILKELRLYDEKHTVVVREMFMDDFYNHQVQTGGTFLSSEKKEATDVELVVLCRFLNLITRSL